MRILKRNRHKAAFFLCTLGLLLALAGNTRSVHAASGISVDSHTQEEIRQKYRELMPDAEMANSYARTPVSTAPYDAGAVSEDVLQNGLNTLNLVRYVAGIPANVRIDSSYQEIAQTGALVMAANQVMTHYPVQPAGMGSALYELGAEGCSSSNIASGYINLYDVIVRGWMWDADSTNIDRVGHRRWCLNPTMQATGFGINGRYYAMYAFDGSFGQTSYKGVAWPARNMPLELLPSQSEKLPWSISMGTAVDKSSVSVTLKRTGDGKTWHFSSGSSDGPFYVNNENYGQTGCIIFRPNDVGKYRDGDHFEVTITGANLSVSYDVSFFWMHDHIGGTATCQSRARCEICGAEYGDPGDHFFSSDYTIDRKSTCQTHGARSRHCTVTGCTETTDVQEIPLADHTWGEWKTTKEPTLQAEGEEQRSCPVCHAAETRPLARLVIGTPQLTSAKATAYNKIKVTWKKVPGASGYCIYRKTPGGTWTALETVSSGTTSYTDARAVTGTTYFYTVKASRKQGDQTLWGDCDQIGLKAKTSLGKVSGVSLKTTKTHKYTVKWKKVSGASGYQVYCRAGKNGKYKKVAATKKTTCTQSKRKKGTTYYYKIRAYRKISANKTVYGAFSSAKKIKKNRKPA